MNKKELVCEIIVQMEMAACLFASGFCFGIYKQRVKDSKKDSKKDNQ